MGPVVCWVTDRRRCGAHWRRDLVERVTRAARAGVHLVQVRERDLEGRELIGLVRACLEAVSGTAARIVVNDRLDVALAAGAHGVHLPSNGLPGAVVRRVAPRGFLVGRSVHSVSEAIRSARAGGLDYLVFGTVFPTPSKPEQAAAGVVELRSVVDAVPLPVLGIGGMTIERLPSVAAAGATGFAAIGLFGGCEGADAEGRLTQLVREVERSFDTSRGVP